MDPDREETNCHVFLAHYLVELSEVGTFNKRVEGKSPMAILCALLDRGTILLKHEPRLLSTAKRIFQRPTKILRYRNHCLLPS